MSALSPELLTSKVQGEDHESVDAEHAEDHAQAGEQEALPVRPGLDLTPLGLGLSTKPILPRLSALPVSVSARGSAGRPLSAPRPLLPPPAAP